MYFQLLDEFVRRRGFEMSWGVVSAQSVGAPHVRKRLYILLRQPGFRPALALAAKKAFDWGPRRAPPRMVAPALVTADNRRKVHRHLPLFVSTIRQSVPSPNRMPTT